MKEESLLSRWCEKVWLYCVYALGIGMLVLLIVQWSNLSVAAKLMYFLAFMLSVHVFEENTFPGGFFYINNIGQKSDEPMVYPQNRLINMWTNLGAEIFFIILALNAESIQGAVVFLVTIFGFAECIHHTRDEITTYKMFKDKGAKTIYTPGIFTSFFGLLEMSICGTVWMLRNPIGTKDILTGIFFVVGVIVIGILIPFRISTKVKSKTYAFRSNGYYSRYIK